MKAFCMAVAHVPLLQRVFFHVLATGLGQAYAVLRVLRLVRKAAPLALVHPGIELWLLLGPLAAVGLVLAAWFLLPWGRRRGLTIARLRPTSGWLRTLPDWWPPIPARGASRG